MSSCSWDVGSSDTSISGSSPKKLNYLETELHWNIKGTIAKFFSLFLQQYTSEGLFGSGFCLNS